MEPGTGSRTHVQIPANGLTTVFEPNQPSVDIVFIHGFTGHPERTWLTKVKGDAGRNDAESSAQEAERPHKIRKLNILSNPKPNHDREYRSVFWPRDLLPTTAPDARVMTYGYDTHIRHRLGPEGSQNSVYDIAWDFLVALEASRRVEPTRPIIFIAHSLGGIVVKEMLRRASIHRLGRSHLRPVFDSTNGVLFFGTPHGGSDPRGFLQRFAEQLFRAAGFTVNEQIVNTLLPSSERLRELRDEFTPMARQQGWIVHSFQEQIGVKALGSDNVVDDTSSYLNAPDFEVTEHIGQNHMEMCRFVGFHDPEYRKVAAAITHIKPKEVKVSTDPNIVKDEPFDDQMQQIVLDSLRFDQHDARLYSIKSAYSRTCKWLLDTDIYSEWIDPKNINDHHGFFWIKGKPGTGKSTIMKFLLASLRHRLEGTLIISFFFNARGNALEKSTIGLYRSLLLQILEQISSLQPILGPSLLRQNSAWSLELLKSTFEQAIQSIADTPVICIVDALDECPETEVREMVSSFSHLGQLAVLDERRFKVCFSSRHYPYITMEKKIELVLEEHQGHSEDISQYVASELKIGQSKSADEIRKMVRTKSSGIFMWVVLVVQILNKEHDTGRVYKLRRRLDEIPKDLHDLFRDILTRDAANGKELILCLKWVLFAKKPLTPAELYSAVLTGFDPEAIKESNMEDLSDSDFSRYILDCSKGLIETTKKKHRTAQFIHESVRDFLLKDNGFAAIMAEVDPHNFVALSHDELKQCCLVQMEIARSVLDETASLSAQFPFLPYAINNILYHADRAEDLGKSQAEFLATFSTANWVILKNSCERFKTRKYPLDARLLYILAETDSSSLIGINPVATSCMELGNERHKCPLYVALVMHNFEAIKALLWAVVQDYTPSHEARKLFEELFSEKEHWSTLPRDSCFDDKGIAYSLMLMAHESLMNFLLSAGLLSEKDFETDAVHVFKSAVRYRREQFIIRLLKHYGQNKVAGPIQMPYLWETYPLHAAVRDNCLDVVQFLIETLGIAAVYITDQSFMTPFELAVYSDNGPMVRLLVKNGVKVNDLIRDGEPYLTRIIKSETHDDRPLKQLLRIDNLDADACTRDGKTPLCWAAMLGEKLAVKALLDSGKANANALDKKGRTPLLHAVLKSHKDIVKCLLKSGRTEVNTQDIEGRTPLSHAAGRDPDGIERLLLELGRADVNIQDYIGRTPLSWAAGGGFAETVHLLVSWGADPLLTDLQGRTAYDWYLSFMREFGPEGWDFLPSTKRALDDLGCLKSDGNE